VDSKRILIRLPELAAIGTEGSKQNFAQTLSKPTGKITTFHLNTKEIYSGCYRHFTKILCHWIAAKGHLNMMVVLDIPNIADDRRSVCYRQVPRVGSYGCPLPYIDLCA
jgi:hypothetical protein